MGLNILSKNSVVFKSLIVAPSRYFLSPMTSEFRVVLMT